MRIPAEKLAALDGLLTEAEGLRLAELAACSEHDIVELGSHRGKSTCYLASGAQAGHGPVVWAVDRWDSAPRTRDEEGMDFADPEHFRVFCAQLESLGLDWHVNVQKMPSAQAARGRHYPIGLLFIDANHAYESCRADYDLWHHFIPAGGWLAIHDYNGLHPGVDRLIEKVVMPSGLWENVTRTDSLWTGQRIADEHSLAMAARTREAACLPPTGWDWVDVIGKVPAARRTKDCGVILVAFGEKARRAARHVMATLEASGNRYPVVVVGDEAVDGARFIAWDGPAPFDSSRSARLRFSAGLVKPRLVDLSPFARTLYMDVDTAVLKPLAGAFALLADHDLLVCGHRRQRVMDLYNKPNAGWYHELSERDATVSEWGGDGTPTYWNSGVLFFSKTDAARDLFHAWGEEWQRFRRWDEQLALMRAAYKHPCRIGLLPLGWNAPHRQLATHIFHNYGRGIVRSEGS